MTASTTIHLYALISLRALADYDPYEYQRATDLSKQELDSRIEQLLKQTREVEEEPRIGDLTQTLHDLRELESTSETPTAKSYLLRQVKNSSLERAYQLARVETRRVEGRTGTSTPSRQHNTSSTQVFARGTELEFLRLGVMRLLRDLPGYVPRFGYYSRNVEIDCFLEPTLKQQPPVIVEAKNRLDSDDLSPSAMAHWRKLTAGWGKHAVSAVLTTSVSEEVRARWLRMNPKSFVLLFDPEINEFHGRERENFVKAILSRTSNSWNR
jgi:hypothetical protein